MKKKAEKRMREENFEEERNIFEKWFGDTDDSGDESSDEETRANLLPPIVLKIER